ncbi:MAG TPA: hypothetical protein DCL77_00025, partial [Prolixibacteraceae bacterium]|nr:hypothetical protein [Prolixibacteraceae bacterium]
LFLLSAPALIYLIFLILHYLEFGVFFFAEHLNYITIDSSKILYKFNSATSTLFLAHGRNVIFFISLVVLIILLFRKRSIDYKRFLFISLAIIISYLIFTILNFFTYRYVFPVMGIVLLASLVLIQQLKINYQAVNIASIACILSISAYYSATKRGQGDADLGYTQFLEVHQQ